MRLLREISIISFLLLFALSCRGIKFAPDFFVGDHRTQSIVNEDNIRVYSDEEHFDNFACMTSEKIKELQTILSKACYCNKPK